VETQPREFFDALKRSLGVALATRFGLDPVAAVFVKDLRLAGTRFTSPFRSEGGKGSTSLEPSDSFFFATRERDVHPR
jgi:hypothetical protein